MSAESDLVLDEVEEECARILAKAYLYEEISSHDAWILRNMVGELLGEVNRLLGLLGLIR